MTHIIRTAGVAAAVLSLAATATAQHQHQAGGQALGKVHFETSCKPDVRDSFVRWRTGASRSVDGETRSPA